MPISKAADDAVRECLVQDATLDINRCAQNIRNLLQLDDTHLPVIERNLIDRATIAGVPMEFTALPRTTPGISAAVSPD
jgi:hypothetical protein